MGVHQSGAGSLGVEPHQLFDDSEAELLELVRRLGPEDRNVLLRVAEALVAGARHLPP